MSTDTELRDAHRSIAITALEKILAARQPADVVLAELYREHRCGSRDRQQISGAVYGVLRDFRALKARSGSREPERLLETWLTPAGASSFPEDIRLNLPSALYPLLQAQFGDQLPALAQSINTEASVDLRVNLLKANRDEAIAALAAESIEATPTPYSPTGLRLKKRAALQATQTFKKGLVEPQDEGSQLLAQLLNPQPGEKICDFCAGAGGKTLALGALMKNGGELMACDVSPSRLEKLAPRAERAGLTNLQAWLLRGDAPPPESFDAVLVDAPCSATGTWRRNPELRLRPLDLPKLAAQQLQILNSAAGLVKPGGRLVYATCSLLREENEQVVENFLLSNPVFKAGDAGAVLAAQGIDNLPGAQLKLLPHRHGTDGFFAAVLRRD